MSLASDTNNSMMASMIELDKDGRLTKAPTRKESPAEYKRYHYIRTAYDVGYAITVTEEILNLEPVEDKLAVLKRKYELSSFKVVELLQQRVSFVAIYNLFDTVEHNKLDT